MASHQDLGAFTLLLSLQDEDALRLYSEGLLEPIERTEGEYGGELLRSLEAYIEHNGNWERAARQLYCHRHTLRYRIRKIEELTGRDLSRATDRIELWLALRARELREVRSGGGGGGGLGGGGGGGREGGWGHGGVEGGGGGGAARRAGGGEGVSRKLHYPMISEEEVRVLPKEFGHEGGRASEVKSDEYRVALTPVGARELAEHGHEVLVQRERAWAARSPTPTTRPRGRASCPTAEDVWGEADLVLKVKEPQSEEVALVRPEARCSPTSTWRRPRS